MPPSNLTHASSRAITRPPCRGCGTTMVLASIAPHTPGYDMRTFECPSCNYSESSVVHFGGVGSDTQDGIMMAERRVMSGSPRRAVVVKEK
jgi:hypothetical protein